jgi:class 3 adenylate cyclase
MVSCCTRAAILHSRMDGEVSAVREVFGESVPIFGYYSGGEIVPYQSRYAAAADPAREPGGSAYHTTTVALLAVGSRKRPSRVRVPRCEDCPPEKAGDLRALLDKSEEILDGTEAFLSNLSRKSYQDAEKLRKQNEVIHRYTPHDVFDRIGAGVARGRYELAERAFEGAFLFMDVKGFTAYSESHSPGKVVGALNQIFEPATDIVYDCGGDVDKFIGDCIFAAFPSPARAVAAGRRVLRLIEGLRARGNPFTVRIGINAGRAIRANVGSSERREYTYIGDAVNLAQRLESNCEPGRLLLSRGVYEAVRASMPGARRRKIAVKGRKMPVVCYDCA